MPNPILAWAAAAASVMFLAACGGGSSSSAPPRASSAPSVPASTGSQPSGSPTAHPTNHPTEFNPPGDIPDNQVFVDYVAGRGLHVRVPEGWARSQGAGVTRFTDKYNSVAISLTRAASAPTIATAKASDVASLRRTEPRFANSSVTQVIRNGGTAIRIVYQLDSPPNPVTGKVVRDTAERYEFWHRGREAIVTLTGPKSADNVDPWRTISNSLHWR